MHTLTGGGRKLPGLIALALLAAGCTTSTAPGYFRLEVPADLPAPATPDATQGLTQAASDYAVIIGPFGLAEYLDRPQIVTRDGANGITVSDYERWAEPLDSNFQAAVAGTVRRLTRSDRVLEFPAQAILKADRRVMGRISRLDVDAAGLAVLEVQWGVRDGTGAESRPGSVSRYEARVTGAGIVARVAALNATVTAFSVDVAAAVR